MITKVEAIQFAFTQPPLFLRCQWKQNGGYRNSLHSCKDVDSNALWPDFNSKVEAWVNSIIIFLKEYLQPDEENEG